MSIKTLQTCRLRILTAANTPLCTRSLLTRRCYATHGTTNAKRKAITPFNDDGHVPWSNLSAGEKTGRAVQQSFNLGMIVVGILLTGGVGYFLYTDVLSLDSKTAYFNRAFDRIQKDPRCVELLGDGKKMTAFGEETFNKWRRARPLTSSVSRDQHGNEHLLMHFHVQGPRRKATVHLHLVKHSGQSEYEYKYLFMDAPGHDRVYLENIDASTQRKQAKRTKILGINWG